MKINLVRIVSIALVLITVLTTSALALEPQHEQPVQPEQPVLPVTQQHPCTAWITLHWLEAELYKLGIDDFELKLESSISPEKDYVLELIAGFPIEEGHTRKVFAQLKDGEIMMMDGYILFPKERGEYILNIIKNIIV